VLLSGEDMLAYRVNEISFATGVRLSGAKDPSPIDMDRLAGNPLARLRRKQQRGAD